MKKMILAVMAVVMIMATSAKAETRPARLRLLVHGHINVQEGIDLRAHFIPAGNLVNDIAPLGYLGLGYQVNDWLNLEPAIGYDYTANEMIYSLRLEAGQDKFYTWADYEYTAGVDASYWFVQAQYKVKPWLHVGFEEESWGRFARSEDFSHGGGPNILFRSNHWGVDLAWHYRNFEDQPGTEFFTRVHLFF
ncbi:MAG: hypothetical protein GF365_02010 [Candidatus Buchananbacteria bacterium]|nr:hypothetical protein [Candidatus Buchananbacteria bacterium]